MASKDATRRATVMIGLDDRQLSRDLDGATRKVRKTGGDIDRIGRRAGRGGSGGKGKKDGGLGFGMAAGMGMSAVNSATSFVTDTVAGVYDFEKSLVRMQIAAGKSNAEIARTRQAILDVSKATGIAAPDILAGTQTYVDLTGDVAGAESAMSSFARIAQASGAKVSDVATATAALKESMGLDAKDIETAFSGLIQQGKAGAVSLADLAGQLSAVAPRFAKFGGSGINGIADLGAALQVARKGFGSASQAATGLEALMGALALNAGKFEAAGVKIFKTGKGGKKEFRGFVEIIDGIGKSRLVKDPTALTKAWGSKEAAQAFDMLTANRKELEKIYEAGKDAGAVQRDLSTYLESSAGKTEQSMNRMKVALVEALTPERIAKFANALEAAARMVETIAKHADKLADAISPAGGTAVSGGAAAAAGSLQETLVARGEGKSRGEKAKLAAEMMNIYAERMRQDPEDYQAGQYEAAAAKLREQSFLAPASDPWARGGGPAAPGVNSPAAVAAAAADPEMLARLFAKALGVELGRLPGLVRTEVKVDGDTIAKASANARANRAPAKGR